MATAGAAVGAMMHYRGCEPFDAGDGGHKQGNLGNGANKEGGEHAGREEECIRVLPLRTRVENL